MKKIFSVLSIVISFSANSEIRVAFFSSYTPKGNLIQFEPGGRFSHVAIYYDQGWMHADPVRGVEVVKTLNEIGYVSAILINTGLTDLSAAQMCPVPANRLHRRLT